MNHVASLITLVLLNTSCALSTAVNKNDVVEDIYVVRSVRLERTPPTDFCAESRTGFRNVRAEDRYDFLAVETNESSGTVVDASGRRVGQVRACFGSTADSLTSSFYAEGTLNRVSFRGQGDCRTIKRDMPKPGITSVTCHLNLSGLSAPYTSGTLVTNTVLSRQLIGPVSDPPGYTQPSIAIIRVWKH